MDHVNKWWQLYVLRDINLEVNKGEGLWSVVLQVGQTGLSVV